MFKIGPLLFPDGETHFNRFGDAILDYGKADRDIAYGYVKRWRRALDVGANVGIFSVDFASRFEEVVAFEPVPPTLDCLKLNAPSNVRIEPFAIAEAPGKLKMFPVTMNSGGSFITNHPQVLYPEFTPPPEELIDVPVRTIDSYDFDWVDLIKLDIQGAEYLALLGAKETILRHKPVIMVEQKPVSPEAADMLKTTFRMLRSWGMVAKEKAQSDRVFVFDE